MTGKSRRPLLAAGIAAVILGLVGVFLVWGYLQGLGERTEEADEDQPLQAHSRVTNGNGLPVITLDARTRQRSGITIRKLTAAQHRKQVRAYVRVLDGEALTDLRDHFVRARARRRAARATLAKARKTLKRDQSLYRGGKNIPQSKLQDAQEGFHSARAGLTSARSRVRALTATARQHWGPTLARAVTRDTKLFQRLTDRKVLLLQATLPPDTTLSRPPSEASLETGSGKQARITLVSPAPHTDPAIQGTGFFYTVPADSGVLPGMRLRAFLPSGEATKAVRVPDSAIVWAHDRAWAYRRTGTGTFTRIRIPTDWPAPGGGYFASNLPRHPEVVTRGAQLMLSEESRSAIPTGGD